MQKTIILFFILTVFTNLSCSKDEEDVPNTPDGLDLNNDIFFAGDGTFYTPTGLGNCSEEYPASNRFAAMNKAEYDNSNACGSYVEITRKGTAKKVIVKILDQCPECLQGDIDLSKEAFLELGTEVEGRIPITWRYITQPTDEKIAVRVKTGSSRYYFSIQILNHRYRVKKVEIKNLNGEYVVANRQSYNYFLDRNGVFDGSGPDGPYDIRITDINDNTVTARINLAVDVIQQTDVQFPIK